jgi:hypothetical protein
VPNAPLYPNNSPHSGYFVILCEGDLPGYEAAILGRWLRDRTPTNKTVDVRPCGTSSALIGTADAVGRTTRIIVVEDRDFRTVGEAKAKCDAALAEREERNLAMRGWVAWTRNEIENYFLDDEVLLPAMREAFECTDSDTRAARENAINALRVFQVVQAAASAADGAWSELEKARRIGGGKPKWVATGLEAPQATTVRGNLESHVRGSQGKVYSANAFREPFLGKLLLDAFDSYWAAWKADPLPEDVWKREWAGKEVLRLVRQQLAAKFRPPMESKMARIDPVDWFKVGEAIAETDRAKKAKLQDQARGAMDRDIERAIQPVLIKHLWAHLEASPGADMNADFSEIAKRFTD